MRLLSKSILPLLFFICTANQLTAQQVVSGTVYDYSKRNYVEGTRVESTGGKKTITDSMGRYSIIASEKDSLSFIYQNKATQKFSVKDIVDPSAFDISLHVTVKSKYSTLKEVVVFARSYRQDSIENRQTYANGYNFMKPSLSTSISPDGMVGADLDEIINMFRFKRNKRMKAFQARLVQQEQDKFVSYRFNKNFVRRITHLEGAQLDTFMVWYLPTYEFASTADDVTFNRYILNASYEFKIEMLKQDAKK